MAVDIIARGIASNKADLVNGKVPSSQLPSYVDDVIEVANYEALPNPGETGKIYITLNDNKTYRWSGSTYVQIGCQNKPIQYIELTGWNETAGWHDGGTLTEAQANILLDSEMNYIWLNNMHRLDFRYRDDANNKATYSSGDGTKTHVIEINLTTKGWRYQHEILQSKLEAGDGINISDNKIKVVAGDSSISVSEFGVRVPINTTSLELATGGMAVKLADDSLVAYNSGTGTKGIKVNTDKIQPKLTAGDGVIINNNVISADIRTYKAFPSSWPVTPGTTIASFCAAVNASFQNGDIAVGDAFLGNVNSPAFFNGAYVESGSLGSAEVSVQIMTPFGQNCVQLLTTTSSNNAPYHWEYTYVDGALTEGWRCWTDVKRLNSSSSTTLLKYLSLNGSTYKVNNLPDAPTEDGEYKLVVSGGQVSWEKII